jgi:diguanylate cyclase (GGDEF)-like protein
MKHPETPEDEENRLRTLRSINILDTPAEERFDRLTRLAKRMFNVPIALVSLIDENRQWFKSRDGLDISETSREISFCAHAILNNEIFIIPDATKDARFADNPLVVDKPYIRFYAGCPLRYIDGSMLGSLCIIDTKPRTFSEEDYEAIKDLAELAEHELMGVQLATLDDLTRISNRRGFITLAENSLKICARQDIPASLVYFDLNKFKNINDEFGHAEGDRALRVFAEQMRLSFRESDVYARLGGDEFVALLTDTSMEQAVDIIAKFRHSLALYNERAKRGYDISFSDGILNIQHQHNHSIERLLDLADSLMYQKKNQPLDGF